MKHNSNSEDKLRLSRSRILQSRVLQRIPPANIDALLARLQTVSVRAADTVIRQGEIGDYFYLICDGKCHVTRQFESGTKISLASLGSGESFGEEALLSDGKRNATVTMETDGVLLRLSKADFDALLREPLLNEVEITQAERMVRGGAILLDVRAGQEHRAQRIRGSMSIPIDKLRDAVDGLDSDRIYVCYCETGSLSAAAAFLLRERGYDSYVLKGGLQVIR